MQCQNYVVKSEKLGKVIIRYNIDRKTSKLGFDTIYLDFYLFKDIVHSELYMESVWK